MSVEPLEIGDKCQVQWRDDDQFLDATVIERRPLGHRKRKKNDPVPDLSTLKPDEMEYYIHYVLHDRRLDAWVTLDKFQLETLQRYEAPSAAAAAAADTATASLDTSQRSSTRRRSNSSAAALVADTNNDSIDDAESTRLLTGGNWHGGNSGDPSMAAFEREHEEATKVKNIEKIIMGSWETEAWYYSPFPPEYCDLETLYVCEFCLCYMKHVSTYKKHNMECKCRHPPGQEIYRHEDLAVYEIDGKEHRAYCQKLCLLAKLFLDHKTLYFETSPFLVYVVTKVDNQGAHIVGYFSKEKVRLPCAVVL
jgi:histone acetyltransferase MYST1